MRDEWAACRRLIVDEAAGWLWTGVISFLLLRGPFDTEGPAQ